jgi:eukaryotic-like serine/threonine-protein kinase
VAAQAALIMSAPDPQIGQNVAGRYRVVRMLARGGMSTLYELVHLELPRMFAMKKLSAALAANPTALARFRREADLVSRLRHPNIVEVFDFCVCDDGSPAIVMELLRGEDLASRLARAGALGWPEIARVADQVLAALAATHRAGIVHRDLKPSNVFLARDDDGEERAILLDFGISKALHGASVVTVEERVPGTALYMSPEQASGQPELIGPETDVWAMGAILYEMATGAAAFNAQDANATLYRITHGAPAPVARGDAPAAFLAVVAAALSRDPKQRVTRIVDLRARLRAALANAGAPASVAKRARRAGWRRLGIAAPAALLIGLVGTLIARGRGGPSVAPLAAATPPVAAAPPPVATAPPPGATASPVAALVRAGAGYRAEATSFSPPRLTSRHRAATVRPSAATTTPVTTTATPTTATATTTTTTTPPPPPADTPASPPPEPIDP